MIAPAVPGWLAVICLSSDDGSSAIVPTCSLTANDVERFKPLATLGRVQYIFSIRQSC